MPLAETSLQKPGACLLMAGYLRLQLFICFRLCACVRAFAREPKDRLMLYSSAGSVYGAPIPMNPGSTEADRHTPVREVGFLDKLLRVNSTTRTANYHALLLCFTYFLLLYSTDCRSRRCCCRPKIEDNNGRPSLTALYVRAQGTDERIHDYSME